jgi:hypothetical protein
MKIAPYALLQGGVSDTDEPHEPHEPHEPSLNIATDPDSNCRKLKFATIGELLLSTVPSHF